MDSSNYKTLKQKERRTKAKALKDDVLPKLIQWSGEGKLPEILFSDGGRSVGSCIHCLNPRCMEYSKEELKLEKFTDFPADQNLDVCPTRAIIWPFDSETPLINSEDCIMCGLCVSRCPVSAIHLDPQKGAIINDMPNKYFILTDKTISESNFNKNFKISSSCKTQGSIIIETDQIINDVFERISRLGPTQILQFPNHLARNLFIELNNKASMRRLGDTNIRMDMVLESSGSNIGTIEVEFGQGILDAPRNILDNIAVMSTRYGFNKNKIIPLIVSFSLPNQRSEYWQVIKDINTVLKIYIGSITIGALIILLWNRCDLSKITPIDLYADSKSCSIKEQIEKLLMRRLKIEKGYPGLIESQK